MSLGIAAFYALSYLIFLPTLTNEMTELQRDEIFFNSQICSGWEEWIKIPWLFNITMPMTSWDNLNTHCLDTNLENVHTHTHTYTINNIENKLLIEMVYL